MAENPAGSITSSRPIEITPVRIGRGSPGAPNLQAGRLYPATVVKGGEQPVIRLLGQNVGAEPRYPTLQQGNQLLVRPQIQNGRVVLQVMSHSDIQDQVATRFGRMVNRFPWPLPQGRVAAAAAGRQGLQAQQTQPGQQGQSPAQQQAGAGGKGAGLIARGSLLTGAPFSAARTTAGTFPGAPGGQAPGNPAGQAAGSQGGPGATGGSAPGGGQRGGDLLPRLLLGQGPGSARLQGRPSPGSLPRPPLTAQMRPPPAASAQPGSGTTATTISAPSGGSASAQAGTGPGSGNAGQMVGASARASHEAFQAASSPAAARRPPSLAGAMLGAAGRAEVAQLSPERAAVRGWLERLLEPAGDKPERGDQRQASLWDRLLTEKGRLLLDRWAHIPLPFGGEESGAWVQVQERHQEGGEEEDGADNEPPALRIWLNADHLGAMEVLMPMQAGRTWRIRCERPATVERLEAERSHLERLCRRAGHPVALVVEGPESGLGEPPQSLQEAATIEHTVSSRA